MHRPLCQGVCCSGGEGRLTPTKMSYPESCRIPGDRAQTNNMYYIASHIQGAVTLYVIVKGAVPIPVFLQEAESVVIAKVFELNETAFSVSETKKRE